MRWLTEVLTGVVFGATLTAGLAAAPQQTAPSGPVLGSRPQAVVDGPIPLTLADAIDRALKYNLAIFTLEQDAEHARGARWREFETLLPSVNGRITDNVQKVSLAAFGFRPGIFPGVPAVIGPFNVFDARVAVSQTLFDRSASNNVRRETWNVEAANDDAKSARDLVVLVAANMYLQAVTAASRIEAVKAQVDTAQALFTLAGDLQRSGLAPQIDVIRAQVELETERQRLIVAQNDLQKQKLQLGRAIGLAVAQPFEIVDKVPYAAMPAMTVEDAIAKARESRADLLGAKARVEAAGADERAARARALPTVAVTGDYGAIGSSVSDVRQTFSVAGAVRVPIFDGGDRRGRTMEAGATLRARQAELDDLQQRVEADVRIAFLDLQAADAQLGVAQSVVDLSNRQLEQAQDRFRAGVTNNLEVIQAQEAAASAAENRIASLYQHNVAKAQLAHAMGLAEALARTILGQSSGRSTERSSERSSGGSR